jgi:hypothetical protein
MKPVLFLVLLAGLVLTGPVAAQEKPAAKPEVSKPEISKPGPKAEARKKSTSTAASKAKRQQDARHCLQRPTNTEIIKCAEAYL